MRFQGLVMDEYYIKKHLAEEKAYKNSEAPAPFSRSHDCLCPITSDVENAPPEFQESYARALIDIYLQNTRANPLAV